MVDRISPKWILQHSCERTKRLRHIEMEITGVISSLVSWPRTTLLASKPFSTPLFSLQCESLPRIIIENLESMQFIILSNRNKPPLTSRRLTPPINPCLSTQTESTRMQTPSDTFSKVRMSRCHRSYGNLTWGATTPKIIPSLPVNIIRRVVPERR